MTVSIILIAAFPFLLSLLSRASVAITTCLVTSLLTLLLSVDPGRASLAWSLGMLLAAVAVRERFRLT